MITICLDRQANGAPSSRPSTSIAEHTRSHRLSCASTQITIIGSSREHRLSCASDADHDHRIIARIDADHDHRIIARSIDCRAHRRRSRSPRGAHWGTQSRRCAAPTGGRSPDVARRPLGDAVPTLRGAHWGTQSRRCATRVAANSFSPSPPLPPPTISSVTERHGSPRSAFPRNLSAALSRIRSPVGLPWKHHCSRRKTSTTVTP